MGRGARKRTRPYVKPTAAGIYCVRQGARTGLCDNRGVGWGGRGREVQEGGDVRIPVADSYGCVAETNILQSNYSPIKHKYFF